MAHAILVTGASGFVGAAATVALRNQGYEVLGVDLSQSAEPDFRSCDLCDAAQLAVAIDGAPLAAIVHCGAVSGPALFRNDPGHVARSNMSSTVNLLEYARQRSITRFVFASSASVYGPKPVEVPVEEECALHPTSVYAASKVAGEALVEAYVHQHGLSAASLRIAAVYGPGRRTPCFIRDMIVAGLKNEPLAIPFGRDERYHYVHIDDVAAALVKAVGVSSFGAPAYTIAADRGITLGELADLVRRIVPGPPIIVAPGTDPLSDPQGPYELGAVIRDFAWRPALDLATGIRTYAQFLANHQEN
ncbi:NAD(P)-dependent oxidoreductase [Mesorhizobium sp.]|uniref:NAD-dependent epimerase/dehydratase family protein n=1 Tax=Mesorhizobium sp. TaxID=1871066 RepID=UPI0025E469D9|nr:NAD(P)-dependent oxidoreductase [Mesorhizobium sp.]